MEMAKLKSSHHWTPPSPGRSCQRQHTRSLLLLKSLSCCFLLCRVVHYDGEYCGQLFAHGFGGTSFGTRLPAGMVSTTISKKAMPFTSSSRLYRQNNVKNCSNERLETRCFSNSSADGDLPQSSSSLFPRRQTDRQSKVPFSRSLVLKMANEAPGTSSSSEISNKVDNPLVKVWLRLRKLIASLWNILIQKPIQLLKPKLKKDIESKGDIADAPISKETIVDSKSDIEPEEDVLSEMENLPVVEEAISEHELESLPKQAASTAKKQIMPKGSEDAADVETEVESAVKVASEQSQGRLSSSTTTANINIASSGERQIIASPKVDLTGNWTLLVDDDFKAEYDEYLRKLGQPALVRTLALTVIGSTKEETRQMDKGRKLFIKGTNVRGSWDRTLETSEASVTTDGINGAPGHAVEGHQLRPMITADDEEVEVASWWEEDGTVHKSWVVGGKKYGGGDFENRRYLKDNGNVLICESIFHPNEEGREKACVTWKFLRQGAIYGDRSAEFPNIFDVFSSEEEKKKKNAIKEEVAPLSRMVVGDILDNVATSDEANGSSKDTVPDVEEEIERESWVPPAGNRWAIAAPGVDISGKWKLIITEHFKEEYDAFLKSLGQPLIVRGAAVVLIGNTREETKQSEGGRLLHIKGINAKGIWERTLVSSGSDFDSTLMPDPDGTYDHFRKTIVTADSENVAAESWWEDEGTKHVSWTLGVKKYGGGSFESKRYLENDGNVYVCESTFHPDDTERREKSHLKWRFLREGATIFVGS